MLEKQIGWQKYEDLLEKQISSPMLKTIIEQMVSYSEEAYDEDDDDEPVDTYEGVAGKSSIPLLPISKQLMDDMAMLSDFDCWLGHTNFDITPQ